MGKIVILFGPDGAGKETLLNYTLMNHKTVCNNIESIKFCTTRLQEDSLDTGYYFVSDEEKDQLEKEHKIIDIRSYPSKDKEIHYFSTTSHIDLDTNNYITIGTLDSVENYTKVYGDNNIIPIFIKIDKYNLLDRGIKKIMETSSSSYDILCSNFMKDSKIYYEEKLNYPYTISNDSSIEDSFKQLSLILKGL